MFEWSWVRVVAVSLAFGAWSIAEGLGSLLGSRRRPAGRRPRWSHFVGFVSVIVFYAEVVRDGHAWNGGAVNEAAAVAALACAALRLVARALPLEDPAVWLRVACCAALPVVAGAPLAWLGFTAPQLLIAADELRRAHAVARGAGAAMSAAPLDRTGEPTGSHFR